jgi:hypothetical protein
VWDKQKIVMLTKAAMRIERPPAVWGCASNVVIRKPGKHNYMPLKAYHAISLLSCMGIGNKNVVVELLSEVAGGRGLISDAQFRSRKQQLAIDAAASIVDQARAAGKNGHITGLLLMDINTAF